MEKKFLPLLEDAIFVTLFQMNSRSATNKMVCVFFDLLTFLATMLRLMEELEHRIDGNITVQEEHRGKWENTDGMVDGTRRNNGQWGGMISKGW